MAEGLSRKELYDLGWSEPLKPLCSRFGISDVALKKTCARFEIPTPERGYWAKKDAGKLAFQVAIRPSGMDDQVLIAAGQSYWYQDWKNRKLSRKDFEEVKPRLNLPKTQFSGNIISQFMREPIRIS
jgi:hypothetical protein